MAGKLGEDYKTAGLRGYSDRGPKVGPYAVIVGRAPVPARVVADPGRRFRLPHLTSL